MFIDCISCSAPMGGAEKGWRFMNCISCSAHLWSSISPIYYDLIMARNRDNQVLLPHASRTHKQHRSCNSTVLYCW